ncbi:MAG TPA: hypothetical protein VLG71_01805, partial [Candidatus Limnocylindria bacterium]|nr:hypothetical protein [Candidatus Limnocylindria bacterium]
NETAVLGNRYGDGFVGGLFGRLVSAGLRNLMTPAPSTRNSLAAGVAAAILAGGATHRGGGAQNFMQYMCGATTSFVISCFIVRPQ